MLCLYHNADLDGRCSAAIVRHFFPSVRLHGINYGDPVPWSLIESARAVFMVDFSLQPFSDMVRINQSCPALHWYDHHKSAIEQAAECGFCATGHQVLDSDRAGCEITWDSLADEDAPMPRAVRLLGRYDVWKHHEHPGSLEFQYGMRMAGDTSPENDGLWFPLLNDCDPVVNRTMRDGITALHYATLQDKAYASACSFETTIGGLRAVAINRGLANSLQFASVYDPLRHDVMLSFVWRKGKWRCSMYSTHDTVDCASFCRDLGGGGHKNAAGFSCDELPFDMGGGGEQ